MAFSPFMPLWGKKLAEKVQKWENGKNVLKAYLVEICNSYKQMELEQNVFFSPNPKKNRNANNLTNKHRGL